MLLLDLRAPASSTSHEGIGMSNVLCQPTYLIKINKKIKRNSDIKVKCGFFFLKQKCGYI